MAKGRQKTGGKEKAEAKRKQKKEEPPQLKRLKTRVRNLETKLSESVPKGDLESLKSDLEGKISELEAKLARSVPEGDLEAVRTDLKGKIAGLEAKLARSVPKSDADSLNARIGELEARLSDSVPKKRLNEASTKLEELEATNQRLGVKTEELESQVGGMKSRIQSLELEESSHLREIDALKGKAKEVDARTKETREAVVAVAKRARYQRGDGGGYWMSNEDWEELRGLLTPPDEGADSGSEHKFEVSGKCVGCGMTERDLEQALSILRTWPEDSEKEQRMAELNTCKGGLLGKGRLWDAPEPEASEI